MRLSRKKESGQILLMVIVVLGVILFTTLFIITGAQLYYQNSAYTGNEQKAIALAEAGIDKTIASLNATGGSFNPDPNQEVSLGDGSYTVTVTTPEPATRLIETVGYYPSKANAKVTRKIKIQASVGIGAAFNYGIQVGEGGLDMSNGAGVFGKNNTPGSVYSNGNITMRNGALITGDAIVAGGTQANASVGSDCSIQCGDFKFGTSIGGQTQMDVGQSFSLSSSINVNKVSLKLKKFGSPTGNLTVKILADSGGKPDKNNVLTTATIANSLVTSQYGFIEANFTPSPNLVTGQIYWIVVISPVSSQSNYWGWQEDLNQGYLGGRAVWSPEWNAKNSVWNAISGADMTFQVYTGGVITSIIGNQNSYIRGNAYAHNLDTLQINGDAYYQTQSSLKVQGQSCDVANTHCHPNSVDPVPQPMPLSDANIQQWQDLASSIAVHNGDINSCPATLPAGKYVGSISLPGDCIVTVGSPIWVTGNFSMSNRDLVKLDPSYGLSSGVLVVDNFITMANGNVLRGSGTAGSYLILVSNFNSRDDPQQRVAIDVTNGSNSGILYSNLGTISIFNLNVMIQITGWKLSLGNGVAIIYDQGLASTFFKAGPGGSFSLVKGTYQLQ